MKFSSKGIKQLKDIFHMALECGELLSNSVENAYMTDLLQATINSGIDITAISVVGGWIEIDTVEDLRSKVTLDRVNSI